MRYPWHLVTRFFGAVRSRPLHPAEQDEVCAVLSPEEAAVFFRQQPIDQRHGWQVARRVRESLGENQDAIAAALLHDVGKIHSGLGPIARSLATVFDHAGVPMPQRWRLYREHEELGAEDLRRIGARPLAIAFAAGESTGDRGVWDALVAADDGRIVSADSGESAVSTASRNSMPPEVDR